MRPEGKKDIIMLCEEGLYDVPWMSGRVISIMTGGRLLGYNLWHTGSARRPGTDGIRLGSSLKFRDGRVKIREREIRKGGVEAGTELTELTSLSVNCRS